MRSVRFRARVRAFSFRTNTRMVKHAPKRQIAQESTHHMRTKKRKNPQQQTLHVGCAWVNASTSSARSRPYPADKASRGAVWSYEIMGRRRISPPRPCAPLPPSVLSPPPNPTPFLSCPQPRWRRCHLWIGCKIISDSTAPNVVNLPICSHHQREAHARRNNQNERERGRING